MIIKKRIEYINRYREIAINFSSAGFGFLVEELGLDELLSLPKRIILRQAKSDDEKSRGERIRIFIEEMGTTFIKLGQIASTRPDLIPIDIIDELEKLQSDVPPFNFEDVKKVIEDSLDVKIEDVFLSIEETPIGSASTGQVHKAVTIEGETVAVKVQRPNIERRVRTDLEILHHLATLAEQRMEWARRYHLTDMIEEFSEAILDELDYTIEANNADKIRKQFEHDSQIKIPEMMRELSTKNVLVMEFIDGIPINHHTELEARGYSREVLAERLTNAVFHQIIIEGFFHGDPHPGNVSVLEDETIALMDFGMVGRLSQDMKYNFGTLLIGMMRKDASGVVKAIVKMGVVPTGVEMNVLNRDAEKLRDKYYDIPLSYLNIGEAVQDIFQIANKHRIGLPQDFTILGKSIITLESVVSSLDPEFSIMDVAEPFGRLLVKEKYDPRNIASRAYNNLQDVSDTAVDVSNNLKIFSDSLREKKVPVQLSLRRFEELFRRMDRIGNRLSFSIVLLSFSIIMVGLIVGAAIAGQTTVIWQIPAIEIGFVLAVFLFLGLLYSIFKSGRF
ncbi:ABC1 kinase family protein [Salinicoccus sp. Marseille-QA3877]